MKNNQINEEREMDAGQDTGWSGVEIMVCFSVLAHLHTLTHLRKPVVPSSHGQIRVAYIHNSTMWIGAVSSAYRRQKVCMPNCKLVSQGIINQSVCCFENVCWLDRTPASQRRRETESQHLLTPLSPKVDQVRDHLIHSCNKLFPT